MKETFFLGNLTKDWEVRSGNEKTYAKNAIAIKTKLPSGEKVEFFELVAWGKQVDALSTYTHKGSRIMAKCEPVQNVFTNKDGNKVSTINFKLMSFEFAGGGKREDSENYSAPAADPVPTPKPSVSRRDDSFMRIPDGIGDDMPFN